MKIPKIILILLLAIIALAVTGSLLIKNEERTQLKMGTFVKITLCGPRWLDFDKAFKEAFAAVDEVDAMASIYNQDSQVSKLNKTAHPGPVAVSSDLFTLIRDSIVISRNSDGAFDITVGPLVELWSSYRKSQPVPLNHEIEKVLPSVGYGNLLLDEAKKSVFFKKNGMSIDLSAIAKGYAVDRAVAVLKELGFKSAIVNAGGDLYCLGKRRFFRRWRIGIIDPEDKNRIIKRLYLSDKAVATSGGYERYFTYRDRDYTHLIDPRTGYAKESRFSSVTVVGPNSMLADALATAVSVGGRRIKSRLEEAYPGIEIIIED